VALNNTLFVWSTLAQPFGPPALFSSMFGIGHGASADALWPARCRQLAVPR
jgi:hypothetical protein